MLMSLKINEAGWGGNFFKNTDQEIAFCARYF